jgi:hypothetical protein
MAQTERSPTAVRALLADNTTADISPEDMRDALASTMGYGCMVLSQAGATATMSSVGASYTLVDIFDTIHAESATVNTNGTDLTLSPTYKCVPGSDGFYRVASWFSFAADGTPTTIYFRMHINASPGAVECVRSVSGSSIGVASFEEIVSLSAADVVDMRVKIDAGTSDLIFSSAGFLMHRVG